MQQDYGSNSTFTFGYRFYRFEHKNIIFTTHLLFKQFSHFNLNLNKYGVYLVLQL